MHRDSVLILWSEPGWEFHAGPREGLGTYDLAVFFCLPVPRYANSWMKDAWNLFSEARSCMMRL